MALKTRGPKLKGANKRAPIKGLWTGRTLIRMPPVLGKTMNLSCSWHNSLFSKTFLWHHNMSKTFLVRSTIFLMLALSPDHFKNVEPLFVQIGSLEPDLSILLKFLMRAVHYLASEWWATQCFEWITRNWRNKLKKTTIWQLRTNVKPQPNYKILKKL